ncbi:hypothetical protein GE061_010746 [Apolygus lucorum]|uniref:Chitin-binding type-2 domain-containing protein n=1 Tax=Apolygus lucorum TaxID=248454 RepID=A0A8S9XVE2_APOLU|nr:hypothetical protein GE061_010746 [Apolygus lucorum]
MVRSAGTASRRKRRGKDTRLWHVAQIFPAVRGRGAQERIGAHASRSERHLLLDQFAECGGRAGVGRNQRPSELQRPRLSTRAGSRRSRESFEKPQEAGRGAKMALLGPGRQPSFKVGGCPEAPPPRIVRPVREEGDATRPRRFPASGVQVLTADTAAMKRILLIILCLSTSTWGIRVYNGTTNTSKEKIAARERIRRLIPYMTFYLAHPVDQSLTTPVSAQGYTQQVHQATPDKNWPYEPAQPPPQQQPQYLVPSQQYQPYEARYIQQPSSLTKMITQNYLAIAKQQGKFQPRLNLYPQQQRVQGYSLTNLEPVKEQQADPLEQIEDPLQYSQAAGFQYSPIPATPIQSQYKSQNVGVQYQPELILQYQTPAPIKPATYQYKHQQPIYKTYQKQPPIKQHLTEVTQPQLTRTNPYYINKEDLGSYNLDHKQPYVPVVVDTTEPTVSIMQSQEIEVETEPPKIPTIVPKYRPPVPAAGQKYHAVYIAQPTTPVPDPVSYSKEQYEYEYDDSQNVNDILEGVSISKTLPDRITSENLDSSIKTLSKLLKILQRANALPNSAKEIVKTFPRPIEPGYTPKIQKIPIKKPISIDDDEEGATPGQAGVDYPTYDEIPQTSFSCKTQRYKGFFGDPETRCQVWHYCDLNGGQASFLCPNGTIFSQVALTCDWWFNVKCASTAQLYVLNERLYKYILPQKPSFPEDYAGPLVDRYLTHKFKEIEQGKNKTEDASKESKDPDPSINDEDHQYSLDDVESENKVLRSLSQLIATQ